MFYALRDIAVGEELTVDYSTFREATMGRITLWEYKSAQFGMNG